ncbi:MAG: protein translocase subunit SecD [Patescibacteria group bacterium]|nr:protein translocase subunit SecD [Patescibacteria group bacterium]
MKDAKGDSFREILTAVLSKLGSFVAPATPRGRVRRATLFIVVLLLFSGLLSYPNVWNDTANRINGWAESTPGFSWVKVPTSWDIPFRLGLDLQGGTHLVYVADMGDIPASEHDDSIAGVRDVIERRVNAFGVSEPLVQTNRAGEQWRLIVDLAGVKDISEAITLIGETPILEFKEANDEPPRELTAEEQTQLDTYNKEAEIKMGDLLRQARQLETDFEALARDNSEDILTKDNGGKLENVQEDGYYAALVKAIKEDGTVQGSFVSKIVESEDSYHVVRFDGTKEGDAEVEASHILICWDGATRCDADRNKEEATTLVNELLGQATTDNFADLAKEHSNDGGSGPQGGELGYFGRGMMVPAFEESAFSMGQGDITGPVESEFGFHIIYKTGERSKTDYQLAHIEIIKQTPADYVPLVDEWKNTELSGKQLKRSTVTFHPQTNEPEVTLEFNEEGQEMFGQITERNVGAPVAIFLDGEPISVPTVNEPIFGGSAVITGSFNIQEAKLLARRLNAGALPVPIHLETQQSVGATLGNDSMTKSLYAGLIGFLVVALFMLMYYRLPGLVAIIALAIYTSINLALYKLIPVTLSLSGIAGFILSVGMAVDANILIFERLKEELWRGRTLQSAIDEGFRRAWLSIRDSNLTTLISCSILFYTSSSLIKGFAFTLGIGVLVSMFSAITVSRTLLRLFSGWGWLKAEMLYQPGFGRGRRGKKDDDESED